MEKNEAVELLYGLKEELEIAETKEETIEILARAGKQVGYKPAFRALIGGKAPEDAIKWG